MSDFWPSLLAGAGATTVPRRPGEGTGWLRHEAAVPAEVAAGLQRQAKALDVPLVTLLLAAHARVLTALSGEDDVTTGLLVDGAPVPLPLPAVAGTWRDVVHRVRSIQDDVTAHAAGAPVTRVFETAVGTADAVAGAVLTVTITEQDAGLRLDLGHDVTALDAGAAARVAGYHLTVLADVADLADDELRSTPLVGDDEKRHLVDDLAGPRRERPDRPVHELVEDRVRAQPDAIAVEQAGQRWTYAELNARANRLARALQARGLRPEDRVAVVTERNLPWAAAVLAVLKAGGTYLPVEPHFPAERIARTLRRAGCRLVVTQEPSAHAVAGMEVDVLRLEDPAIDGFPAGDLGEAVTGDRLAYIYFTSGSTGEPKGAMCEHAGMVNHVLAKIEDLGVRPGSAVAQTAPQCFDISLWQLVSAWVVGGRTVIVEQDVILDVARFAETVTAAGVDVLQLVPSYLEALLSHLEQQQMDLPSLRCISATGEALKAELVQRWFATVPGVPLVNAYGLTETCDDTNHGIITGPLPDGRVPLGPPIANVHVYVVDDDLQPVPLGAPGEIVFSGVCVGRGYINDPERTARAFVPDPIRPGERLYRSGDRGRWAADGTLEFLGRRDTQVKIRGFRIEVGEIDNALLRVPGVRDGAVVVLERADGSKHLVGFYAADRELDVAALRTRLGEQVPEYMVPTTVHHRDRLPLTANSKIDRKALTALAAELDTVPGRAGDGPLSDTEQRLAAIWAGVLGIPQDQIGPSEHFFDRGGTSLTAVKVVAALDRAVTLKQVVRTPVLSDLALLLDQPV